MLRTAVRRRSWSSRPGTPAFLHAVAQVFPKPPTRRPRVAPGQVREQVGHDAPRRALEGVDPGQLLGEEALDLRRHVHDTPFAVLRGARVEPERASVEVDVPPLQAPPVGWRPRRSARRRARAGGRSRRRLAAALPNAPRPFRPRRRPSAGPAARRAPGPGSCRCSFAYLWWRVIPSSRNGADANEMRLGQRRDGQA